MSSSPPPGGPLEATAARPHRYWRKLGSALVLRLLLFGCLWIALTREPLESWPYGVVVVGLVLWLSLLILPPRRQWPLTPHVLVLVPLVLWESVTGAVDVALRAFRPSRPLDPDVIDYPLQHPTGLVPVALGYLITILPGTLAVDIEGGTVRMHVVDRGQANQARVARLERWLIWAFAEEDEGAGGR